jgi:hypothetical protein
MKKINKNTILQSVNKTFQPVEKNGVIYWVDKVGKIERYWYNSSTNEIDETHELSIIQDNINNKNHWSHCFKIVAQSSPSIEGIPIISLDNYVEGLGPNKWTDEDILKAIKLSQEGTETEYSYTQQEIMDQISSISLIEVDDQFNIISYV